MTELAANLHPIESPCVGICRLDENDLCVGCFRTAREIGEWLSYSDAKRSEIMQRLPARAGSRFDPLP